MSEHRIKVAPETILLTVAALVGAYLLIQFLSAIRFVLVVFLLAVIFAQAVEPLVNAIERTRIRRIFAVIIAYLLVLQIFLVIGAITLPPLILELQALVTNLPVLIAQAQELLSAYYAVFQLGFPREFQEAVNQIAANLADLLPSFLLLPFRLGSVAIAGTLVLVVSVYWLLISKEVKIWILGLLPPDWGEEGEEIVSEMAAKVGGWVRGQIILSTTIAVLTFVGLTLLNIPFAILLAIWAGITEIIPIVGPFIGAIPAVFVALLISPLQMILVIVLYIVIQQVENHLIVPNVMSREVGLQPLLVILAISIGAEVMGIVGALLAVPLTAALQVLVVHTVEFFRRRE